MESQDALTRVKRAAADVAHRLEEAAQTAGDKLSDFQEAQRLTKQIRDLRRERERCKNTLFELVMRMFDQGVFVEALLKPEYQRVKEIDAEVARLDAERAALGTPPVPELPAAEPAGEDQV